MPGLALRFWPGWAAADADALLERLRGEVPWKQERLTLFGRTHPLPRLTCWVGDPGCSYTYSGVANAIEPWSPLLQHLRERVERATGCRFNSLLLNRYRDGRDKLHWHADDEAELDPASPIASLSFGAARSFRLKPKLRGLHGTLLADDEAELDPAAPIASLSFGAARSFRLKPKLRGLHGGDPLVYELAHGDLLVMDPPTQEQWLHQVPPRLRVKEERINLTFRLIRPQAIRLPSPARPAAAGGEGSPPVR